MCEIAIANYDSNTAEQLATTAMDIYKSQRSSLGLVAVHDEGDHFEYGVYKSVSPEPDSVHSFIEDNDAASRLIIHGRLATHGRVNVKNAHPIDITCEKCGVDYVLHNGIIRGHRKLRERHKKDGHEYVTNVDSEALAHAHGNVPLSFEDSKTDIFSREPAFILLNSDRIYIYNSGIYQMNEMGFMKRHKRTDISPAIDSSDGNYVEVILRPENGGDN